jgi:hypothetical protein
MPYQHFDDEALDATYKDRARRLQWLGELQMRDEEAEREREQKKKEEEEVQAEMECLEARLGGLSTPGQSGDLGERDA